MKHGIWLVLGFAVLAVAQETPRPQLADALAAQHGIATYLAQGPGAWQPAVLDRKSRPKPDFLVAADGSGTHTSLQAAVDAVAAPNAAGLRFVIGIAPGVYRGQVCVQDKSPLLLVGMGASPADVRILAGRYAGEAKAAGVDSGNPCQPNTAALTVGTASSATLAIFSNDVQVQHLTVENDAMNAVRRGVDYPIGANEAGGAQAVALMTQGDKIHLQGVHLLGHQDTLYVRSSPKKTGDRVYVQQSLIAGDVDFIFGAGTLVVDDSTIVSRAGRRTGNESGYVLAPSTDSSTALGILVTNSRLLGEAGLPAGSIALGRAWDQGVPKGAWQKETSPNGQALVRNSVLGAHIGPWAASTARRPFQSSGDTANRLTEWRNMTPDRSPTAWATERDRLNAMDGWAAATGGTRGGADALTEHVYTVRNRAELVAALATGPKARIVRVQGRIDLSTDDAGKHLGIEDYRDPAFDPAVFLAAFDPTIWGKKPPSGPLEEARQRSSRNQAARIVVRIPSNTTLIGVDQDAIIANGMLFLEKVDNVIIRNLRFEDAYDYFPAWDPKDNASGEWNSEYDNVSLRGATHVWIDHCSFDDGPRPDHLEQIAFGQQVQRHDGMLDITQQSNWVTVSWNHFRRHDKTTLVGSSDGQVLDVDKLKVSFHHNWYEAVKERTPRVRYGQVHVYNNLFDGQQASSYPYAYSLGVGIHSSIVSERNVWLTTPEVGAGKLVRALKGDRFTDRDSLHNGKPVDLATALRETYPQTAWSTEPGWTPALFLPQDAASEVEFRVRQGAGAGRLLFTQP